MQTATAAANKGTEPGEQQPAPRIFSGFETEPATGRQGNGTRGTAARAGSADYLQTIHAAADKGTRAGTLHPAPEAVTASRSSPAKHNQRKAIRKTAKGHQGMKSGRPDTPPEEYHRPEDMQPENGPEQRQKPDRKQDHERGPDTRTETRPKTTPNQDRNRTRNQTTSRAETDPETVPAESLRKCIIFIFKWKIFIIFKTRKKLH